MIIHHRGLVYDRFDTPFGLGTLIWARDCHNRCPGCFHQDRFDLPIYEEDSKNLLDRVQSNPFVTGVVLGGFEWVEQYEELLALLDEIRARSLEVILYTHYTLDEVQERYPELLNYKRLYLKCGEYDRAKLSSTHISYGVPLASTNQQIYKVGVDV